MIASLSNVMDCHVEMHGGARDIFAFHFIADMEEIAVNVSVDDETVSIDRKNAEQFWVKPGGVSSRREALCFYSSDGRKSPLWVFLL